MELPAKDQNWSRMWVVPTFAMSPRESKAFVYPRPVHPHPVHPHPVRPRSVRPSDPTYPIFAPSHRQAAVPIFQQRGMNRDIANSIDVNSKQERKVFNSEGGEVEMEKEENVGWTTPFVSRKKSRVRKMEHPSSSRNPVPRRSLYHQHPTACTEPVVSPANMAANYRGVPVHSDFPHHMLQPAEMHSSTFFVPPPQTMLHHTPFEVHSSPTIIRYGSMGQRHFLHRYTRQEHIRQEYDQDRGWERKVFPNEEQVDRNSTFDESEDAAEGADFEHDDPEKEAEAKKAFETERSVEIDVPEAFLCPITCEAFVEPVVALSGHTYERHAIEDWFRRGNRTDPVSGVELKSCRLVENKTLRSYLQELRTAERRRQKIVAADQNDESSSE